MSRKLRVLAAFLMVPVVLFATPQTALAATPGPWVSVSLSVGSSVIGDAVPGTIDSVDCKFALRHEGGWSMSIATGYCVGLPDVTAGYTQDGEAGSSFVISATGVGGCSASSPSTFAQHSANGTMRVAGTITSGSMSVSAEDCTMTEVCITLASGRDDCVSTTVAPGEDETGPTTGSCAHGFPTGIKYTWVNKGPNQYNSSFTNWDLEAEFKITMQGVSTAAWYVVRYSGASTTSWEPRAVTTNNKWAIQSTSLQGTTPPPMPARDSLPWGYQVFATPSLDLWNEHGNPFGGTARSPATALPTDKTHNYGGITQPERCRWYIGKRVADLANTTADDPFADTGVDVVPVEPEPDPEPVPEPPTPIAEPEDEESWLGLIWALLKSIWNTLTQGFNAVVSAVKGLGQTIADALSGMLDGLFLPSDGFMEAKWGGVENKWQDTSPGKYVSTLNNFQPSAGSSCGGVPLNVTLPGGVVVDQRLGDACSGSMASAAGVVRTALIAVFGVAGAIACVRAVGAGLGFAPPMKGGAS